MQLIKYGITLESLTEQDLELVRNWRNSNHVRLNMEYQTIIDSKMQSNWFNSLDKNNNLYFTILQNSKKIGLINLKDIDWEICEAEAGIFIGDTEYLNTLTPVLATICIMEYAFETLRLKTLKAKIATNNLKAILFNENIGYRKQGGHSENNFLYYETNEVLFKECTKNLRKTLDKLNKSAV
jgi:UDP-4-amino-4,6-dideoxy-N-acetyl-beta-L-altrosamine N-acetyltransferase